jgi:hypothetical protein
MGPEKAIHKFDQSCTGGALLVSKTGSDPRSQFFVSRPHVKKR